MFKENSICISIGGKISFLYCNVVMIDGNHDNCYVHCVQGSTAFHIQRLFQVVQACGE